MFVGYRIDQSSGKDFETIRKNADKLLNSKTDERRKLLKFVGPPITLKELDKRIDIQKQLLETYF